MFWQDKAKEEQNQHKLKNLVRESLMVMPEDASAVVFAWVTKEGKSAEVHVGGNGMGLWHLAGAVPQNIVEAFGKEFFNLKEQTKQRT